GAVFATASKDDAGAPIGLDGLRAVAAASTLPAAAIGGIGAANLAEVARTGVAMAAVISAVASAPDPAAAARELVAIWNRERRE
ncbi:MAG: thiamine phosphate synthase, partial [Candidatus Tumulicola sp.]